MSCEYTGCDGQILTGCDGQIFGIPGCGYIALTSYDAAVEFGGVDIQPVDALLYPLRCQSYSTRLNKQPGIEFEVTENGEFVGTDNHSDFFAPKIDHVNITKSERDELRAFVETWRGQKIKFDYLGNEAEEGRYLGYIQTHDDWKTSPSHYSAVVTLLAHKQ